jgi:DNA-binding response OmpR family regulator
MSVTIDDARAIVAPLPRSGSAPRTLGQVSRVDLLSIVWGTEYDGGSNVVDVVVRTLRRKLGTSASRVETVRGVGYRLR